jgi:tetratricopeptide (TPR) repeat protein
MNVKQIVVVVAIVGICAYLYHLNPKGLVKPKETRTNAGVASDKPAAANVNVATVSATAKVAVGAALSGKMNDLENQLKAASGDKKLALQKQLATSWDDVNQPAPAAFYYQAVARAEDKAQDWLNAGDRFNNAFKSSQDTTLQPVFISNAVEAFQNALKLSPESLEAKTGLGVAYVNGGAMPMQGIALLLEVVKKDPKNLDANLNLGMFSMKSGQYEKAIDRFKTVIAVKPGFEPYYYLAQAYTQIGKKTEAIAAYQKCKELMPDQVFGQRIDQYIKELKN